MKLKTRLYIAFVSMVVLPVILFIVLIAIVGKYSIRSIEKEYGMKFSPGYFINSVQAISESTDNLVNEMRDDARSDPDQFLSFNYLQKKNAELKTRMSYLIVMRGEDIYYQGTDADITQLVSRLPRAEAITGVHDEEIKSLENSTNVGTYIGGDIRALVKEIDLLFSDGTLGSAYVVASGSAVIPQLKNLGIAMVAAVIILLAIVAAALMIWIYRGMIGPVRRLREATKRITSGDYDFTMQVKGKDEISDLVRDFEVMRHRLQQSEEDKAKYDKESRELISNISHDLKTPLTSIRGYVEGIMDGVAATPDKMDRYIKTIYNKTNDMDRLINELTFYSKIDTNRIPYTFSRINVAEYFDDCAEEVGIDLEEKGITFTYENKVKRDTMIIADAEQMKRVINNIISNSVKYMDKPKGKIELRIKDAGDFIQVEIEDNGKGIDTRDLTNIFDRSFRTDAARSSSQGGSGIGLSIVKKIIEDHSGKIWATSQLGRGTTMIFVIRKYQEVKSEDEQSSDHRGRSGNRGSGKRLPGVVGLRGGNKK